MNSRPVVWALNAFDKNVAVHFKTAQAILLHAPGSIIYPVYVLSEDVFAERGYSPFMRPALKSLAHRNMLAVLNHDAFCSLRKTGAFAEPAILVEPSANADVCAQALLRYASEVKANFVAIGTHGRSLVSRWFTASFSEAVLNESRLPLLITGPCQSDHLHKSNLLILPTDFDPTKRDAFEDLLKMARAEGLSIHLFQKPPETLDAWIQTVAHAWGGGWASLEKFYADDDGVLTQEAVLWLQKAHQMGVHAHVITENFRESTAEAIIEYAKVLERSDRESSPTIAMLQDDFPEVEAPDLTATRLSSSWLNAGVLRDLIRVSPYSVYVAGHA